ncbi:MAG: lipoate--protein ligase family protein [Cyanobacteria bacterium HKST-UBA02]|nr:lipoate--protein ligase family protein [Cyanobacteria bacterium HKST-UBA02]
MARLVSYRALDAASNMAVDEAMLDAHLEGQTPPTLRLYGWSPPAVSIGYGQKLEDDFVRRCREEGIDIVRRPTGGRAVLHMNELTYAFVGTAGSDGFLEDSIIGAYRQICQGIIEALHSLGVEVEVGTSQKSYRDYSDCFQATTTADLHINGRKMVGSAQLRRGRGVLQHGSILLKQDQDLLPRLLSGDASSKGKTDRHANLFEILDREIATADLEEAMKAGFEKSFGFELVQSELSPGEVELVESYKSKYLAS